MQIETLRFGPVEVNEETLITFNEGIPGLEQYKKYARLLIEESYPILWLQSMEDSGICLPIIETFNIIPDYVFDIEDADVKALEIKNRDDLQVLSVVVIPEDIQGMTVNLAAPIIINTNTWNARQIVLSGSEYNVRAPAFPYIYELISREEGADDAGSVEETQ